MNRAGYAAIALLIFAVLWCGSFVWKTQYSNALPPEVREVLRIAYCPIVYPLGKLGLIS